MGALVLLGFAVCFAGVFVLGVRWTRPRPSSTDLRRADEAQSGDRADAKTVRDRVFMYWSIYGFKR